MGSYGPARSWDDDRPEAAEYVEEHESPPRQLHQRRGLLTGAEVPPTRSYSPTTSDATGLSASPRSRHLRAQPSTESIHIESAPFDSGRLQYLDNSYNRARFEASTGLGTYQPNISLTSLPEETFESVNMSRRDGPDDDQHFHRRDPAAPKTGMSGLGPVPQLSWQPPADDWELPHSQQSHPHGHLTSDPYAPGLAHTEYRSESPEYEDASHGPYQPTHNFGPDQDLGAPESDVHIPMPSSARGPRYPPGMADEYNGSAVSSNTYESDRNPYGAYEQDDYYPDDQYGYMDPMDLENGPRQLPMQPGADDYSPKDGYDAEDGQYSNYEYDKDGELIEHPDFHGAIGPVRQPQMSKKQVELVNGQLILECKISSILHSFLPRRDSNEFTHMRYTAVTCDPDDFVDRGYQLRQQLGQHPRETELLICVTMYNEDEHHFTRTMHGVMQNISHFCSRARSRIWGRDGWQKIVVCIITDGRNKVHPRTLDALAAIGVYQPGIAKNTVNQKEVTAHLYEYTTQVSLDVDLRFKGAEKGIVPCQMIFCMKERNLKKLNSHRWFFNAIGKSLNPNVCILLDVGTRPAPTSLYHLWKAFDLDSNVAGAAGEIVAGKGKHWRGLLNPLVASQNFEYKMSNILDKPLESVFGYITVLPGALSAYRYHALSNDENGHGPLSQYFKGETLHGQDADVFTANMYLAEDRILCWELVAKRSDRWLLKYVSSAKGETDVPDSVPEFISQRRRWLNGAFFAAVYSLLHFRQVWSTDHSIGRKILLHIEFIYQFVQLVFTFLSLANFYLTFYFIAGSLAEPQTDPFGHGIANIIFIVLRYACVLLICLQFILSMGNRPQGAHKMFFFSMVAYAVIMVYTIFAGLYITVTQLLKKDSEISIGTNVFTNIIVSTLSTVGLYFIMSFLYLDPWHMFTSSAQYFALLPSYICTLQIYAFCNAHDVSWGTKGDNGANNDLGAAKGTANVVELEMPSHQLDIDSGYDDALRNLRDRVEPPPPPPNPTQAQEDYYRAVRTYMVMVWLFMNAVLAMAISEAYGGKSIGNNFYLTFILWSVAALALFRAIGSTTFGILNIIHSIAESRLKWGSRRENGGNHGSAVNTSSGVGSNVNSKTVLSTSSAYARARYGQDAKLGWGTRTKEFFRGLGDKIRR